MKTKMTLAMALLLVSLILNQSCGKDQLEPDYRFWPESWRGKKITWIMENSEKTHENNETNIGNGRKSTSSYSWGDSILTLNGPAGYTVLADYASMLLDKATQDELMPDTTQLTETGEIVKILKDYLSERRDHSADKAFKKIKLAIHKDFYKLYPRYFERLLSALKDYLTGTIGGSSDWTNGTRDLNQEKEIAKLIKASDPDDGWGCNCSASTHIHSEYLKYAEGDVKSLEVGPSIEQIQSIEANLRYQKAIEKYGEKDAGLLEDYTTKFAVDTSDDGSINEYYYLEIVP